MINCPYCGFENPENEIFCEECGRPLKKQEKKKKIQKRYVENQDGDYVYISPTQIILQEKCAESILYPTTQSLKEGKWELVFQGQYGCNLAEYLMDAGNQKITEFIRIEKRILKLFEDIQSNKMIVGSCNLEDFFLPNGDPDNMVLRVVRPLLYKKAIPELYETGEFAAPEIKNLNEEFVDYRTDVYLAAIIFNRLIIRNKYSAGNIDAQLFWGYTLTNASFFPQGKELRRFHQWLGECLNMYPKKRRRAITDSKTAFEICCSLEKSNINSNLAIDSFLKTDTGKGKKELMASAGRAESEWNEDSIQNWEKNLSGKMVNVYLLADGISNCDIGSGYIASNIVRKNFLDVLNEYVDDTYDDVSYEMVENLIFEIVRRSNHDIWNAACEYDSQTGSIMGSTFVFVYIYDGIMYTYSLGDSPLYLIRNSNAIPLYCPDNTGFEALKKGMSYEEYRKMDGRDSIAFYIGGEYARKDSDYYTQKEVNVMSLQNEDIIIALSDGVLDYMGDKLSDTDWDKEENLVKILTKNEPLYMLAGHIIKRDNRNGGGDNLSMVLIKVGGNDNE